MQNFIWSTVDYNLDDQTAANIGKFYLENVPDALHVACCYRQHKHNASCILNSRYLSNDDQIGCIAYISSLIAKAYVTFEDAMEVKSNVEAAKRLVTHVKQTNLFNHA